MNIYHLAPISIDHTWWNFPDVACKRDKRHVVRVENRKKFRSEPFRRQRVWVNHGGRNASRGRAVERSGTIMVADAKHKVGVECAILDCVNHRLKVASSAGGKDGAPERSGTSVRHKRSGGQVNADHGV
jgi:hypothetical protein